jgi:hypothetical protein
MHRRASSHGNGIDPRAPGYRYHFGRPAPIRDKANVYLRFANPGPSPCCETMVRKLEFRSILNQIVNTARFQTVFVIQAYFPRLHGRHATREVGQNPE